MAFDPPKPRPRANAVCFYEPCLRCIMLLYDTGAAPNIFLAQQRRNPRLRRELCTLSTAPKTWAWPWETKKGSANSMNKMAYPCSLLLDTFLAWGGSCIPSAQHPKPEVDIEKQEKEVQTRWTKWHGLLLDTYVYTDTWCQNKRYWVIMP